MGNFELKLLSINKSSFIILFTALAILSMLVNVLIVDLLGIVQQERSVADVTLWYVVAALLLAPLIETFIFQKLPIDYFRKHIRKDWLLVIISALPFGLMHYLKDYFVRDVFYAFCFGAVFAYAYVLAGKREDMNAYWAVTIIHAGYNSVAILVHLLVD